MHSIRDQIQNALSSPPRVIELEECRIAAVAAILTVDNHLLFMQRAKHDKDPWSGHISFPGGRQEPTDPSDLDAAIRETQEEIGLNLRTAEYIGRLDDVRTIQPLPPIIIRPHLFFLNEPARTTLNNEAISLHSLPIQSLLRNEGRETMKHPWRGTDHKFPCVWFDNVCLWGLTLHMVDDLLHRLDGKGRGMDRLPKEALTDNTFGQRDAQSWSD